MDESWNDFPASWQGNDWWWSPAGKWNNSTWQESSRSYDDNPLQGAWLSSPITQRSLTPTASSTTASATAMTPSTRINMVGEALSTLPEIGSQRAGVLPSGNTDFSMTEVSFNEEIQKRTDNLQGPWSTTHQLGGPLRREGGDHVRHKSSNSCLPLLVRRELPLDRDLTKLTSASGSDIEVYGRRTVPVLCKRTPGCCFMATFFVCYVTMPRLSFSQLLQQGYNCVGFCDGFEN